MDVAGHLHGDEATQGGEHPADAEDDEGGEDRPALGLGPEALPLHDQQRQDAGADDESDDVGRVQNVQGERRDEQETATSQERRWPLRTPRTA